MNIFPAEIANAIVSNGSYSDDQIAYIVMLVLIVYFVSIAIASAGIVGAAMAVKSWLGRDKNMIKGN